MNEGPEAAYAQGDLYADVMAVPNTQLAQNGELENKPQVHKPGAFEYKSYTTIHPKSVEQQDKESKIAASVENQERHGKQLYVGGLTWWTNDEELGNAIQSCGVNDVISIKFSENRINGQSKGYCVVEIESDASHRLIMERLPNIVLHHQKPVVTQVNKHTTQMFESQAKKDIPGLAGSDKRTNTEKTKSYPPPTTPQIIQGLPPPGANVVNAPMMEPNFMQQPSMQLPPGSFPPGSIIVDAMGNVIQGTLPMGPPPGFHHQGMPHQGGPHGPTSALPPGHPGPFMMPHGPHGVVPHINPAFMPPDSGFPIDPMTGVPLQTAGLNEADMESMRRNQAVASTAIQRAMTDAHSGEFESGIETLVTAISLIKQSTTANTEPAQVLVQSLQDCLQGLEGQLVQKGSGHRDRPGRYDNDTERYDRGDRRRRRDRSRSSSRSHDKKKYSPHRSRSRERKRR